MLREWFSIFNMLALALCAIGLGALAFVLGYNRATPTTTSLASALYVKPTPTDMADPLKSEDTNAAATP